MKDKQTNDNTRSISFRIPTTIYEKIEAIAEQNQRTVSGQLRYMIDEYLRIKES